MHLLKGYLMKALSFLIRIAVGGTFVYAGISKLAFPGEFLKIVQNYGVLPSLLVKPLATVLPWAELLLGILLITGLLVKPVSLLLISLLLAFIVVMIIKSTPGNLDNCGFFLFSSWLASQSPSTLILKNVLLITSCLYLLFLKETRHH